MAKHSEDVEETCLPSAGSMKDLKLKFLGPGFQKLEHEQDRQTHRQTQPNTLANAFAGSNK